MKKLSVIAVTVTGVLVVALLLWRVNAVEERHISVDVAAVQPDATEASSGKTPDTAQVTHAPMHDAPANPMKQQLAQIADAYRESMRFPSYSKPLSEDDWQMLHPRAFVPDEVPVDGVPDLQVSIELNQSINDLRQPLPVRVLAASPTPLVATVEVSLRNGDTRTAAIRLQASAARSNVQVFEGVLPAELLAAAGAGEVVALANLQLFSGKSVAMTALTSLYGSGADLRYLADAYVDGANLVIPAHFDVYQEGFYRVQANLMDAATGNPVSHLNAAFMLSAQAPVGLMKVHAETLRAMQAPGPYVLTDFDIVRSSSWPGDSSGYGSAIKDAYEVAGFSLDRYSDEPYVDAQAQQRLQFLQRFSEQGLQ